VLASFKDAIALSPYTSIHRFDSFAPERKDADCKWFIDGKVRQQQNNNKISR